jgi:hypothetical protein
MHESTTVDGVREFTLDSWTEFFALSEKEFSKSPAYVYRGQAHYAWPLSSSLDRLEKRFPKRKNLAGSPDFFNRPPFTDEEHLNAFKRALRGRRGGVALVALSTSASSGARLATANERHSINVTACSTSFADTTKRLGTQRERIVQVLRLPR